MNNYFDYNNVNAKTHKYFKKIKPFVENNLATAWKTCLMHKKKFSNTMAQNPEEVTNIKNFWNAEKSMIDFSGTNRGHITKDFLIHKRTSIQQFKGIKSLTKNKNKIKYLCSYKKVKLWLATLMRCYVNGK